MDDVKKRKMKWRHKTELTMAQIVCGGGLLNVPSFKMMMMMMIGDSCCPG